MADPIKRATETSKDFLEERRKAQQARRNKKEKTLGQKQFETYMAEKDTGSDNQQLVHRLLSDLYRLSHRMLMFFC